MKAYTPAELKRFLTAVDRALARPTEVVIIGGAAAAIAYGVTSGTRDIDTWTTVRAELAAAADRAREATGLAVPLAQSRVADAPHDFESRLEPILPRLTRLRAAVPERHDLVLMKLLRCDEHDLQAIEEIHRRSPLDPSLLVSRCLEEMDSAIVAPRRLRSQVLVALERLFPDQVDGIARRLRTPEGRGGR